MSATFRVAFVGVAVSTVATLVCVITVPLLYNYMQHMQSLMQSEVDFCKSRSSNIWREVTRTQVSQLVTVSTGRVRFYPISPRILPIPIIGATQDSI
uniref:Col_cuticle_N domain-containing protein n=1 Tax=Angiostrongylus cantonensis TaxID=6313 RepID=A0A0K0DDH7_ANGCA